MTAPEREIHLLREADRVFASFGDGDEKTPVRLVWARPISGRGGEVSILDGENKDKDAPFIEGPDGKIWPGLRSDIPQLREKVATLPEPEPQVTDFAEAVRSRKKFALNDIPSLESKD